MLKRTYVVTLSAAVALSAMACGGSQEPSPQTPADEQGPVQGAGQEVDEAASDVEQGAEDAVDATGDAMGEAGEEVDEATEDTE